MYNIAIVLISSGMGGGENSVLKLIKNIDKSKFNIFLITNQEHIKNYENYVSKTNIFNLGKIYPNPKNIFFKYFLKIIQRLFDWRKLYLRSQVDSINHFIHNNNIHLLHAQLSHDLYLTSLIKEKNQNIKTIYTARGYSNFIKSNFIKYGLEEKTLIKSLNNIDFITGVSKGLVKFLQKKYDFINTNNSIFIPNGLLREEFTNIDNNKISEKKEKTTIVYMGGEKYVKGGDILIQAVKLLHEKYNMNNFQLEVYGVLSKEGLFYNEKENERLKIKGFIKMPEPIRVMSSSDIVVMPSRSEGFANVALEAIALGLPIVASNIDSFKEVIIDGENGILCELNPDALAKGLKQLINSRILREYISNKNKKYEMYWWDEIIRKYETLYVDVIKSSYEE